MRVQDTVARVQFHPVPLMEVAVKPCPSVLLTNTAALEASVPTLETDVVNVNPLVPWMTEVLATTAARKSTIGAAIVVGSIAELLPEGFVSPPPEIVAVFITKAGVVDVTSTVTVITG